MKLRMTFDCSKIIAKKTPSKIVFSRFAICLGSGIQQFHDVKFGKCCFVKKSEEALYS